MGNKKIHFYTTVTSVDFKEIEYINELKNLNIGFELALLTPLNNQLVSKEQYDRDLAVLKTEINLFSKELKKFQISIKQVRIHQPAGYTYYWFNEKGFDFLNEFFIYCRNLDFEHFVIHAPYGKASNDLEVELKNFREKLKVLSMNKRIEVEEIIASNNDLKSLRILRFYNGELLESLLKNQNANILLDVYECGSSNQTVQRMNELKAKGFELHSIHIHKNKHKILSNIELEVLLNSNFQGAVINEGFIKENHSFDEFLKTKSSDCIVSYYQRIEILKHYIYLSKKSIVSFVE